jgi:hypothetical protein
MPKYKIDSGYEAYHIYRDGKEIFEPKDIQVLERKLNTYDDLLKSLNAALAWIDTVPQSVVLPTMPGFDRDHVDAIIAEAEGRA